MPTKPTDLHSNFQQIWERRYLGDIATVQDFVRDLDVETLSSVDLQIEHDLLLSSLDRHAMNLDGAEKRMQAAQLKIQQNGLKRTFQFCMQQGILLDIQSKFSESFKIYQEASRLAKDDVELFTAKINLATCLYNLHLPMSAVMDELGLIAKRISNHPFLVGLDYVRVCELGQAFAAGDLARVSALSFRGLHQGLYMQSLFLSIRWAKPFLKDHEDRFTALCLTEKDFFQKEYSLQTLRADPRRQAQKSESTIQLKADRIFYWTWKWLEKPDSLFHELLAQELSEFPFDEAHLSMSTEDFFLLRSAGGWLSLFDDDFKVFFDKWLSKYFPAQVPEAAFYEMDLACQKAFANGSLVQMRKEFLPKLPQLEGYFDFIESVFAEQTKDSSLSAELVVHPNHSLIAANEKVVSEPLARFLTLLKEEDGLPFDQVLSECFGIGDFDSLVHSPKVNNLVHRLKGLLPDGCLLVTKNQRAYLTDNRNQIQIIQKSIWQNFFPQSQFSSSLFEKKQTAQLQQELIVSSRAKLLALFEEQEALTRDQIQSHLGLSKATMNRRLSVWLDEKFLKKSGSGKNTRYHVLLET